MEQLELRKQRFLQEPYINSQLPLTLPEGSVIEEFSGECNGCGEQLPDNMLRGNVTKPISTVINIDAIGFCKTCLTIFPLVVRMREYNGVTYLEYQVNGRWVRSKFANQTLWEKFCNRVFAFKEFIVRAIAR